MFNDVRVENVHKYLPIFSFTIRKTRYITVFPLQGKLSRLVQRV